MSPMNSLLEKKIEFFFSIHTSLLESKRNSLRLSDLQVGNSGSHKIMESFGMEKILKIKSKCLVCQQHCLKRKLQNRYENTENQEKSKVKHLRNVAAKEQN